MGVEILVVIAVVGFRLFAECRLSKSWRICSGILALIATGFASYYTAGFIPELESFRHRHAMKHMADALSVGDTNRVEQAVQTYNAVASTGSTYRASSDMLKVLNQDQKSR
jgi:ketol-acid reductoisomerase